jgi:Ca2+-binding RTX toxin-like protein
MFRQYPDFIHALEPRRLLAAAPPSMQPDGSLLITGTAGNDKVIVYWNATTREIHALVNGVDIPTFQNNLLNHIVIDTRRGDDVVQILSFVPELDVSTPPPVPITIWTHAGRDTILGGNGPERIYAGDDDDVVSGGDGRDTIYGGPGPGNDILRGDGGSDFIVGEDGNDVLRGDGGNDHLIGGANSDRMQGNAGNDLLEGGGGRDFLAGQDGDDVLLGGPGSDVCDGGAGANDLQGGRDTDTLLVDKDRDTFDLAEASAGECVNAGVISGAGKLTKVGGGTLQLTNSSVSGSNVYDGTINLTAGTLAVSAANIPPAGKLQVSSTAKLVLASADAVLSVSGMDLAAATTIRFTLDGAKAGKIIVRDAGALNAHGVVIEVTTPTTIAPGTYTLIDYEGVPAAADFTLGATPDDGHAYALVTNEQQTSIDLVVT